MLSLFLSLSTVIRSDTPANHGCLLAECMWKRVDGTFACDVMSRKFKNKMEFAGFTSHTKHVLTLKLPDWLELLGGDGTGLAGDQIRRKIFNKRKKK